MSKYETVQIAPHAALDVPGVRVFERGDHFVTKTLIPMTESYARYEYVPASKILDRDFGSFATLADAVAVL